MKTATQRTEVFAGILMVFKSGFLENAPKPIAFTNLGRSNDFRDVFENALASIASTPSV